MSESEQLLSDRFVMHAGKRGTMTLWGLIITGLWVVSVIALVQAVAQRTVGNAGGAGHVFLPTAGIAFTTLALCFVAARWWEDETEFRVSEDRLEIRHGVGSFHWPAVRLNALKPVVFTGDGSSGPSRVYVQQGFKRVQLGTAGALLPLQYSHWVLWMRHHGMTVEQRWDVAGS